MLTGGRELIQSLHKRHLHNTEIRDKHVGVINTPFDSTTTTGRKSTLKL